jgi:hypothetical protein
MCEKMVEKKIRWDIISIMFLVVLLPSSYASATSNAFEEYAEDSHFIATRGNLPDTMSQEWKNTILDCWLNITAPSYCNFDESIKNIGNRNGVLTVYLGSDHKEKINDSQIDKIYQKIASYCEKNSGISDIPVVFLWAEDKEDLIFEYDQDAFENVKKDPGFMAAFGTVPIFENESEWANWSNEVFEARHIDKLDDYYVSLGGPLVSYGFKRYSGYIEVGVNKNTPEIVNDSSINEIYHIIAEHYEKEGISDIPVVFIWHRPPTKDTPGFTSIILILCMIMLIMIRK